MGNGRCSDEICQEKAEAEYVQKYGQKVVNSLIFWPFSVMRLYQNLNEDRNLNVHYDTI